MYKPATLLIAIVLLLSGCGGSGGHAAAAFTYAPTSEALAGYVGAVETDLGDYMNGVADESSFASGITDVGHSACESLAKGGTRDEFVKDFRDQAASTVNGSHQNNDFLDQTATYVWAESIKFLCPQLGQ